MSLCLLVLLVGLRLLLFTLGCAFGCCGFRGDGCLFDYGLVVCRRACGLVLVGLVVCVCGWILIRLLFIVVTVFVGF